MVLFFCFKQHFIPEISRGADGECTRFFLKAVGVISLCVIVELPAAYQDAAFFWTLINGEKNMKKLFFYLSLFLSFNAYATNTCGKNCTYSYIQNGTDQNNEPTYTLIMEPIDQNQEASTRGSLTCTDGCRNTSLWADTNVTKVEIKEGITSIGNATFEFMSTITEISLPEGLRSIGKESLYGTHLTHIDIPSSVTSIGGWAFGISTLQSINGLPQGLTSIGAYTFANSSLTELVIPDSVTSMSIQAFGGTTGYKGATIQTLYCSEALQSQCEAAIQWKKDLGQTVNVTTYKKNADGTILYNNHWYQNANDILAPNGHIQKRIYTIDEANAVTGDKNHVSIKYR